MCKPLLLRCRALQRTGIDLQGQIGCKDPVRATRSQVERTYIGTQQRQPACCSNLEYKALFSSKIGDNRRKKPRGRTIFLSMVVNDDVWMTRSPSRIEIVVPNHHRVARPGGHEVRRLLTAMTENLKREKTTTPDTNTSSDGILGICPLPVDRWASIAGFSS